MVHLVQLNGHRYTIRQISNKYNIKYSTVTYRYLHGFRGNDLIKKVDSSKNRQKRIMFKGKKMTLDEIAKATGTNRDLIRGRDYAGLKDDDLVKPPRNTVSYRSIIQKKMLNNPEFEPLMRKIQGGVPIRELAPQEKRKYQRGYHRYAARIYRHRPDKQQANQEYYKKYYNKKGRSIRQRKPDDNSYTTNFAKYFHKYYIEHPEKVKRNTNKWRAKHPEQFHAILRKYYRNHN